MNSLVQIAFFILSVIAVGSFADNDAELIQNDSPQEFLFNGNSDRGARTLNPLISPFGTTFGTFGSPFVPTLGRPLGISSLSNPWKFLQPASILCAGSGATPPTFQILEHKYCALFCIESTGPNVGGRCTAAGTCTCIT